MNRCEKLGSQAFKFYAAFGSSELEPAALVLIMFLHDLSLLSTGSHKSI